jgi:membrane associated rhomboid family serine protease
MFVPYSVDVPMQRLPWANWALVAVTILISVLAWCGAFSDEPPIQSIGELLRGLERGKDGQVHQALKSLKKHLEEPPPLSLRPDMFSGGQLVTSLFVHAGLIHLLVNMAFLFAFGNAVNAKLGHMLFLGCYFLAGIVSGLAWILVGDGRPALGASGAIMGIVGLFVVLFPKNDVLVFATFAYRYAGTIYIPAWTLILTYLVSDLLGAIFLSHGGVAYLCHVFGAWLGIGLGVVFVVRGWVKPTRYEENLLQALGFSKKPLQFEEAYWEERERMWNEKKRPRSRRNAR